MKFKALLYCLLACFLLTGCKSDTAALFTLIPASQTGIGFQNNIADTDSLNILDYLYFYNGGGVAIADFNNDGLPDIYFTSNLESNKLYVNKGDFQFEDITEKAGVQARGNWKTGVTVADVNGDGFADIYVSEVGAYKNFKGRNELFINNGTQPNGAISFTEKAAEYGLDAEGFNTQAVFFDYDRDGDMDMFLVNHSVHSTDTYVDTAARRISNAVSGDKLYRNDSNHFAEVTEQAGIYSSIVGYGLNVIAADINNDGWDDLHVSNDFHENDYYYLNQQNGTFKEINATAFGHESRFSMGADIADLNNDGWLDIITLDMLPRDEKVLKSSDGDEPLSTYNYKLSYGYHYQYSRNSLQLNNGGGKSFSEIALFAGVAATDWSWSPLAADFDNDGFKDLYITNGILRRPNNLDYLKFISSEYYGKTTPSVSATEAIKRMPEGKVSNYMFSGSDSLVFTDKTKAWGLSAPSLSNGAAYADLDNDGDLDLVVNNINAPAFVYRNNSNTQTTNHYLDIALKGPDGNAFAVGAKVFIKQKDSLQLAIVNTTKGFESSSLQGVHFGVGSKTTIDTLQVIWPDGKTESRYRVKTNQRLTLSYTGANYGGASLLLAMDTAQYPFEDITEDVRLPYKHKEDDFDDFNSQALMLHQLSAQGPKMAVSDVNGDGLDDFFICGATGQAGKLLVQDAKGHFTSTNEKLFAPDSIYEEVNALFFYANGDSYPDLYIVSGGNDEQAPAKDMNDRLYLNDGKGNFTKSGGLPVFNGNKSVAVAADIDHDGDEDLFVGGRSVAGKYGSIPESWLLLNDGCGNFSIAGNAIAPGLQQAGMVTSAVFTDYDKDGWRDLVVVGEWMPVTVFKNNKGKFENITTALHLDNTTGLWNTVCVADINNDGFEDLLLGNLGKNSKLHASTSFPLRMYAGDLDGNGSFEQVVAIEKDKNYYPFAGKQDIEKQMPGLIRKNFLDYGSMSGKTVEEIFGKALKPAKMMQVNTLSSLVLMNNKGSFSPIPLPAAAQWSPVYAFSPVYNQQHVFTGLLTGGNFSGVTPYEGRYDAASINWLSFAHSKLSSAKPLTQVPVTGQVRAICQLRSINRSTIIVVARNNDSCVVLKKVAD